jgi:hypothetical protein
VSGYVVKLGTGWHPLLSTKARSSSAYRGVANERNNYYPAQLRLQTAARTLVMLKSLMLKCRLSGSSRIANRTINSRGLDSRGTVKFGTIYVAGLIRAR